MTPRPRDPYVVSAADPVSAELTRGVPYASRPAALDEHREDPFVSVTWSTERIRLRLFDDGAELADVDTRPRLTVDQSAVDVGRSMEPEGRAIVVGRRGGRGTEAGDVEVVEYRGVGPAPAELRGRREARVRVDSYAHPIHAARALLQLAACGVRGTVAPEDAAALSPWLDPAFLDAVSRPVAHEESEVAILSAIARAKTLAIVRHRHVVGWDAEQGQLALRPRADETLTVVLATKRPHLVGRALERIAAQRFVEVEVVLAAHGFGQEDLAATRAELESSGLAGHLVALPAAVPFGVALNLAAERASAGSICKWDDDDLYGPLHLADLVAARLVSGAGVVGKYAEFIHFEEEDETIWRYPQRGESASPGVAGGTLMLDRSALAALGGFPPLPRAVDHHLRERAADEGIGVFRTHGFGYVLVRHAHGHTWDADHEMLRRTAYATFQGVPRALQVGGGES